VKLVKERVLSALHSSQTVAEAAAALGVVDRSIRDFCARNGLEAPSELLGKRGVWRGTSDDVQRAIAIPDLHAPYHDPLALATALAAINKLRPDAVLIMGDWFDCYEISDFTKSPERLYTFDDELRIGNELLDRVSAMGVKRVVFLEGNHENRLPRYLAKRAPELYSMLNMRKLAKIDERGWEWIPYESAVTIGKLHFSHEWGQSGKYAAQRALASTGRCTIAGHNHRADISYGGTVDGERHVAATLGWLGDYDQLAFSYKKKWAARVEWIHGLGAIAWDATGRGQVDFCPIIDGTALVWGQLINGRGML